jgi:microcystin-dependent protein
MSQPFIGEIRLFAGNFAPYGWLFCDGSLQSIAENTTLFTLLGTTYGGDGQNTFALPDLRGRVPQHQGGGFVIGQSGGVEQVTLTPDQMPPHQHTLVTTVAAASPAAGPAGNLLASSATTSFYGAPPVTAMSPLALGPNGGSQPHENLAPFLTVSFIIAAFGIFPSQA